MKPAKIALAALLVGILSGIAMAQIGPHYTLQQPTATVYDGTSACVYQTANGVACWLPISTNTLTRIYSGADISVFALDASQTIWNLPFNSHTWQSEAWSPMAELSVITSSDMYGLQVDTSLCSQPEMRVYQYTGGANFAPLSYCALHIAAALDGTVYRIRSDGSVSHLVSGSWISDPTAAGNGTPLKIVTSGADNVWLITSTGAIKVQTSTGFALIPGTASDVATIGHPGTGTVETFIISTTGANNMYKYSSATNAINGTWSSMTGSPLTHIAAGQHVNVMGLGATGVYHFQNQMLAVSLGYTGYYDCGPLNQCPVGSTHTATVVGTWGSGSTNGGNGYAEGQPTQTITAFSNAYTYACDATFGLPNNSGCSLSISGTVKCSIMGTIAFQLQNLFFGTAQTLVKVNGQPHSCVTNLFGQVICTWPVVANCTPETSPPEWNPSEVEDAQPALAGWWSTGECIRPAPGFPWFCFTSTLSPALKTPQTAPGACLNP